MEETDWEEYYLNDSTTNGEFDSVAFAQDPKPLPCWCRGVEIVPLEELPLFQYLKAHREHLQNGLSSTNGFRIQGLGRGIPRNDMVMPADYSASSSDEEDLGDYVGRYWRRQQPLDFGMSRQQQRNNTTYSHAARPRAVQPHRSPIPPAHYVGPSQESHPKSPSAPRNLPVADQTESGASGASGVRQKVPRHRPSSRKGSFNPQEYKDTFSLNHWVQTHALKGSSHAEDEESDDDDESVFNDETGHTSASSSSLVLSSTEDSAVEQASARRVPQPWRVLEIGNLPSNVTIDELGELLADFGVVENITIREDDAGSHIAEVRMVNEALLNWILECLLTSSPFGTSSKPLSIRILERAA
ncbi:uncharacterized protein LOC135391744 isoform X1 [Ornithodoros turicata]|uniref:uncharacterized protein LOC135391744 isoform X1 n=1 Tax=Ornithodoros turicata TaxID=34597 RepID=UPI003138FA6F